MEAKKPKIMKKLIAITGTSSRKYYYNVLSISDGEIQEFITWFKVIYEFPIELCDSSTPALYNLSDSMFFGDFIDPNLK